MRNSETVKPGLFKKWDIPFGEPAYKDAAAASVWYLLLMVFSMFGVMYIDSTYFGFGGIPAAMANIQAGEGIYRLGIAAFLAGQVCQLFVMFALYRLFRSVDKNQARALFAFVVAMVPIAFVVVLGRFAPLILLNDPVYAQAFGPAQLQAFSKLFIDLQGTGILVVEIFWGLWLLPVGILAIKSGFFPKALGILLFLGCTGHILNSGVLFVPDQAGGVISIIGNVLSAGEFPFFLWLIVISVRGLIFRRNKTVAGIS